MLYFFFVMDDLVLHRMKECCVQLHSNIQKWKELSSRGLELATQIVNLKIEKKYAVGSSGHDAVTSRPHLVDKLDFKIVTQREALFAQLKVIEEDLLKVISKMGTLTVNLKTSAELILAKSQDVTTPLFSTLPPALFCSYAEKVHCAYSEEMSVKEDIIRDLYSQTDRDVLTVYLSCWLHEPYLTHHVTECLEAMLVDCGLRQ